MQKKRFFKKQDKDLDKVIFEFLKQDIPIGVVNIYNERNFPIYFINSTMLDFLGYTYKELQDKDITYMDLIYIDDRELFQKEIEKQLKKSSDYQLTYRLNKKNGEQLWIVDRGRKFILENSEQAFLSFCIDITHQKMMEQQMSIHKERYDIALSMINTGVWEYDLKEKCIYQYNKALYKYGMESTIIEDVPYSIVNQGIIHPEYINDFYKMYTELFDGNKKTSFVGKVKKVDGQYDWIKLTYTSIFDKQGKPVRAIGIYEDVTEEKQAILRYQQEMKYREAITQDIIMSYEINLTNKIVQNYIIYNESSQKCSDTRSFNEVFIEEIKKVVNLEERKIFHDMFCYASLIQAYKEGNNSLTLEYRRAYKDGRIVWVCITVNLLKESVSGDVYCFVYIRDIDKRKKKELALTERAERDLLTGLYNRHTIELMIKESMLSKNADNKCAMFIIDIDYFKNINDTMGHVYGDKVIVDIGRIIKDIVDSDSIAGRIGGDEFVVFWDNISSQAFILEKAKKLCENLNLTYLYGRTPIKISASIGIVFENLGFYNFEELYKKADLALYKAKGNGKNAYYVYTDEVNDVNVCSNKCSHNCVAKDYMGKNCIMQEINDMLIISDISEHTILYMNTLARKVFDIEDYQGLKCHKLLYNIDEPCDFCEVPTEDGFTIYDYNKNNNKYIVKEKTTYWDGKPARFQVFIDALTSQQCISRKSYIENLLMRCINSIVNSDKLDESIQFILKNIGMFYEADSAFIVEVDKDNSALMGTYEWHYKKPESKSELLEQLQVDDIYKWNNRIEKQRYLYIHDVESIKFQFPKEYDYMRDWGISSMYIVPLHIDKFCVGYVGIANAKQRLNELKALSSLTYFIANEMTKEKVKVRQNYIMSHDALTGMLNMRSYTQYVNKINIDTLSAMGVIYLDVNGLKILNKEYGYNYGDGILKFIADTIKSVFGDENGYRFAGDEFVVLCKDITYESFIEKINALKDIIKNKYYNNVYFGHAWADKDIDIQHMVYNAYEIIIANKRINNCMRDVNENNESENPIEILTQAIKENKFLVYLQPKISISTGKLIGAEALIRCRDENNLVIPPSRFIPQLEKRGIISYIDFFMFEEVCKILQKWNKRGIDGYTISVNFSRSTLLNCDLILLIKNIYKKYNINKALIEIEITESIGEIEEQTIVDIVQKIKEMGFKVSMDDFGAQYSNISMLSILPLDVLKLDKSVINDIVTNDKMKKIVRHFLKICSELSIQSVAEGVETKEQLEVLKELNCDIAQGYYLNKPMPIEDFEYKYYSN